jgi:uncharacterized protein YukE
MADSLTVIPGALRAGSGQLSALRDDVDRAGSHAPSALIGAAVACGDGPVQAALSSLAKTTMQRFMDAMAGCQVTSDRLAQAAQNYQQAENAARQAAEAVHGRAGASVDGWTVLMDGPLVRPGGDPDQIEQFAVQLAKAGGTTEAVATSISGQTAQVRQQAQWSGDAADAYTGFTSGLSRSVRALGPPLTQASAPLQDFAAALRTAQQRVDAYAAAYRSLYPLTLAGPNSPSGQDIPLVDSDSLAGITTRRWRSPPTMRRPAPPHQDSGRSPRI